jgi:acetyl esterase/lipase
VPTPLSPGVGSLAAVSYLRRQVLTAVLTANAVRPLPGYYAGVPTMVGGWLTSELAPHLAALTALDALRELGTGAPDRRALRLAAGSLAGLGLVVAQSASAKGHVDRALVECLGPDYSDRLSAAHTDVDLSVPARQLVMPFRRYADDEVEVLRDIPYTPYGRRGLLDVYRRQDRSSGSAPVLLQVHGGAWTIGDKSRQAIPLMRHMAARGWVCVAINYRLSPRHAFPTHLVDVKSAIAWVRAHGPSYGADPRFVAVTGGSAGGHLAALAALTPNDPEYQPGFEEADTRLQAAVPHYGVYDLAGVTGSRRARQLRDRFLGPRVLRRDPRSALAEFEMASPLLRVRPDAPPFLVVHGHRDSLVEVAQARAFVDALRSVSRSTVGYAELPGTQHAFDVFPSIRSAHVVRAVDRFLRFTHDAWQEAA